jgi:hypothetical protein
MLHAFDDVDGQLRRENGRDECAAIDHALTRTAA